MKSIITSILLFTVATSFGQSWQWWVANYNNANDGEELAIATKSNGELTMVVNSDSLRNSRTVAIEREKIQGKQLVKVNKNGTVVLKQKVSPEIKRLFYNEYDQLIALAKLTVDSNITWKLYRINDKFKFIDSATIITYLKLKNPNDESSEPQIILNQQFIGVITKVQGEYKIDEKDQNGFGYFIGWISYTQNAGFKKLFTHFVKRDQSIIVDEYPEVAFNGNYLAAVHKGNDNALYLYNYALQNAVDSVKIPANISSFSIANTKQSDQLYAMAAFSNTFNWNGTSPINMKKGLAIFSLNKNLVLQKKVISTRNFDVLRNHKSASSGHSLIGGHERLMYATENVVSKASLMGYNTVKTTFNEFESPHYQGKFSPDTSNGKNLRYSLLLPYQGGVYQVLPKIGWRNSADREIYFQNATTLRSKLNVDAKNLLLHYSDKNFTLGTIAACNTNRVEITGLTLAITNVKWIINDTVRAGNGISTSLNVKNSRWIKACAEITTKAGTTGSVCDSFFFNPHQKPEIRLDTNVICQWNSTGFESLLNASDQDNKPIEHIWEFWKNDTVYQSDTTQSPNITFTHPGLYSIKLYKNDKNCRHQMYLKDTFTVLPATRAKISGIPWPVCQGLKLHPNFSELSNSTVINWSNGSKDTINHFDSSGIQWVSLKIQSPNGCQTQDTFFMNVKPAGGTVVDYIQTQNDLTPIFHFDSNSVYKKIALERNKPTFINTFWWKPSHGDYLANLDSFIPQYLIKGIDLCKQETEESWQPLKLSYNELSALLEWNDAQRIPHVDSLYITNISTGNTEVKSITGNKQLSVSEYSNYIFQVKSYATNGKLLAISNEWESSSLKTFMLPNAFTPNNDGTNDVFLGYAPANFQVEKISVYARNGQIVAVSNNLNHIWDGTYKGDALPLGIYNYKIEYSTTEGKLETHYGNLILIR